MRNATIVVVRLKGVATEAIKNIVLAGIGKLIVVDADDVAEEDLGAGFFFRDDDVGKKVRDRARPGSLTGYHARWPGTVHHEHCVAHACPSAPCARERRCPLHTLAFVDGGSPSLVTAAWRRSAISVRARRPRGAHPVLGIPTGATSVSHSAALESPAQVYSHV